MATKSGIDWEMVRMAIFAGVCVGVLNGLITAAFTIPRKSSVNENQQTTETHVTDLEGTSRKSPTRE